ncbi:restriction endonuclease [Larkinella sp. GY13]|uniref:restriction endonuclease n=1 Tax=Larkinella sp. GY13 TaxID=3453720 RepID=UPI003EED480A
MTSFLPNSLRTEVAGVKHHEALVVWALLKEGSQLNLVREPENQFDSKAVKVLFGHTMLGYIPARKAGTVSRYMDEGGSYDAKIIHTSLYEPGNLAIYIQIIPFKYKEESITTSGSLPQVPVYITKTNNQSPKKTSPMAFRNFLEIENYEDYSGRLTKYIAEIRHTKLNTFKVLMSTIEDVLESKVLSYVLTLEMQWDKLQAQERLAKSHDDAERRTQEAMALLRQCENTLKHTLSIDDKIDWDSLKQKGQYKVPDPRLELFMKKQSIAKPKEPEYFPFPEPPQYIEPTLSFMEKLIPLLKQKAINIAIEQYDLRVKDWEDIRDGITAQNNQITANCKLEWETYSGRITQIERRMEEEYAKWNAEREEFYKEQEELNTKIDKLKSDYLLSIPAAIVEYCDLVLSRSIYPPSFPATATVDYRPENKMVVVDYSLPAPNDIPTLNQVKYIASREEYKETFISETQATKLYDSVVYQIAIRTIHELFEADQINAIDSVSFNGWVNSVNPATGKKVNNCIVTILTTKEAFTEIDLEHVDPKACFKNLKGVGSSKLSTVTAVQPLVTIDRSDKRFTNHYEVAHTLNDSMNLATMDWEDFEHLVREVFSSEFNQNGAEVKITRASRDGGVDAVAFDPDPIRGGKIVIQAKRYANTVGVSAVRDLYGTVMNEGAIKGILVTTADYGPDAYEFAKGKPLALLSGSYLLHLLEKHGHRARIDLKEAKQLNKNNKFSK